MSHCLDSRNCTLIKAITAERDHLQAEAENLKIENEMLYAWKHRHEQELSTATALAKKYRGQRDELITLWKSRDGSINNMLALIKRIQEVDGDMPKM